MVRLGKGAVFVPADHAQALSDTLDKLGVEYDLFPTWRHV